MRDISRSVRVALAIALLATGCAHRRPEPPATPPASTRPDTTRPTETTPGEETGTATPALDPSELITAEELATIPDPVPGASPEPAPVDPGTGGAVFTPPPGAGDATSWIWRVQVFASPDRAQAERTARDASSRLGESYVVDFESSLYKVRLGSFTSEADAEPLKRRAVLEGFTGAFRVRTSSK